MTAVGSGGQDSFDADVLSGPLGARMDLAIKRGGVRRRELVELLRPYLAQVSPSVKRDLPVARRLLVHLIETRDVEELVEGDTLVKVVNAAAEPSRRIRRGLRWYADLPFAGELPAELFRLRKSDLVPVTQIDDIHWKDGRLHVHGHAYLAGLSVRSRRFNRATVVLRGPRWLPPVRLRTRRAHAPHATHTAREVGCNYDWSGFTATVSPAALRWRASLRALVSGMRRLVRRRLAIPETTTWRAEIVFWSRGARATGLLRGAAIGRTERPTGLRVREGWWVRPVWTSDRALQVVLQPNRAELAGVTLDDDRLDLRVLLPGRNVTKGHARLGGHRIAADFTPVAGGTQVHIGLAVQSLVNEKDGRRLWVEPKGDPAASVMLSDAGETRAVVGDREITVLGDRRDRVVVSAHRVRPVIRSVSWSASTLELRGHYPDVSGATSLTLRHRSGLMYHLPLVRDGDDFSVRLEPGSMPRFGETVPLSSGTWNLSVKHPSGEIVPVRMDHAALRDLDEEQRTVGGHSFRLVSTRFDVPVIMSEEVRPADEKGLAGTHQLRRVFYPAQRKEPLNDATVYVVNDGRLYADSVRAIFEERVRRGHAGEHIWIVKDGAFTVDGATLVRAGSREHHAALARSRHIITNSFLPTWFRAREDQVVVQTWHGTPAKHIGNDQSHMQRDPRPPVWHRQAAEVRGWDLLISQSPWATPVLRRAFGYQGEIIEAGLPRNDMLSSSSAQGRAAELREIRARLGLDPDRPVVLYAPTWRDYDRKNASVRLPASDDYQLLVRAHPMQAMPHVPAGAVDVTTYPDTADLLLVADALVTDYSSSVFDFAATGKPIILFAYDLDKYASKRGLYLDLREQAPGPVLSTAAEVVEALHDLPAITSAYADRYESFRATFAPKDDGKATARVVDHLFG
ncbi:CDP-glycerol glycerophosphotransferase family protein [Nonomuraea soli]|uniref:CDP-glycerol glycerophosphotransferase n=1 Tax=Nonomuraea soli TaxID=1032476 RepID=A0A7W0HUE0_9ACTN|nr:CDP-glycerol glycerophosphotransferase family protein [Nonomuraea soli]MBA2895867.1 CDP-glycerol glycerophosphotransferase [Nonomuraea soli]